MIEINFDNKTYKCPFCGCAQAYGSNGYSNDNGYYANRSPIPTSYQESSFRIWSLECKNTGCNRVAVTAINRTSGLQIDLVPRVTMRQYPEYIPQQLRADYEEANMILESSPKAAATLLRRCLQGMIRDFWGIHEKNLNAEITVLKDKVPVPQWGALDGLRKVGNIGAHMEKDVNVIIDISADEARALMKLIELLFEKWYIARHDEEQLYNEITGIASGKAEQRATQ